MTADTILSSIKPMSPLQTQVARLGVCPFCHTRTLGETSAVPILASQCSTCLKVFVTGIEFK